MSHQNSHNKGPNKPSSDSNLFGTAKADLKLKGSSWPLDAIPYFVVDDFKGPPMTQAQSCIADQN